MSKSKKNILTIIAVNLLIVVLMITVLTVYTAASTDQHRQMRLDMVSQSTSGTANIARLYFSQQQRRLINRKAYIGARCPDYSAAVDYLKLSNTEKNTFYQLIDLKTLSGHSTDSGNLVYDVNYSDIYMAIKEIQDKILASGVNDEIINTSAIFTNPINGAQSIAFYTTIDIPCANNTATQYILMSVIEIKELMESGLPIPPFEGAGCAIVNSLGSYIVKTDEFKSENLFEYFRAYNNLTYPEADALNNEVIASESGILTYNNAAGKLCVFSYESIPSTGGWYYFACIPDSSLEKSNIDFIFVGIFLLFVFVLVVFDGFIISSLTKKLRKELENTSDAMKEAKAASLAKSVFLSRMSHEIRTPLNAVTGYNTIARGALDNMIADNNIPFTAKKIRNCLDKSDVASKHLLSVINDVLDMSSIESGKMTIANERFDFRELVSAISVVFFSITKDKGVRFEVVMRTPTDEYFIGDEMRLNQILTNLLGNASKFTPVGGKVTLEIEQSKLDDTHEEMCFSVTDTGIGMDEEELSHIWKPFEQGDVSTVRKYGGSGLGLSITETLTELMGGTITVKSKKGVGSVFTVKIPFLVSENDDRSFPLQDFTNMHVLVAGSNTYTLDYVRMLLQRCSIRCECVKNVEDAVSSTLDAKDRNDDINLLLVDYQLSPSDGIEAVKEINSTLGDTIPSILFADTDDSEIEQQANEAGITSVIIKPLFQSVLYNQILNIGNQDYAKPPEETEIRFDGKRVLLAEDNEMNSEIAQAVLSSLGFTVDCAANGMEAFKLFNASSDGEYNVILMDVQMPEMNGYDTTKAIRSSSHPSAQSIPIIAMTADAFAQDVARAIESGMNGHVAKPIDIKQLIDALKKNIH